jgi:phage terminase small subunit
MALRNKQKVFVEAYLQSWSATEAAKAAGYSPKTACAMGNKNLAKPEIQVLIKERLSAMQMDTDEILSRLADQAHTSPDIFMNFDGGTRRIDLNKVQEAGKLHLIKSIKQTNNGYVIKMHDPKKAKELLGRAKKLFTDDIKVDAPLSVIGLDAILDRVYGKKS